MRLRSSSSSESGHALLLAALLGIMGFALWATAYRSTQDALGMAATEESRTVRLEILTEAMARAGHLLETGTPPYGSYSCVSRHRTAAGEWQAVVVQFERQGQGDRWAVETRLANKDDLKRLPAMPGVFHDGDRSRGKRRS